MAVEGSDPRGTGARFGRGAVRVFTRPSPPPPGVAPPRVIPAGRHCQCRFEAAADPLADRLAAGLSGIADQGRDAVGAGAQPRRQAPDAPVPSCREMPSCKDRWPGATPNGGRHGRVPCRPPPWHAKRSRMGVAPVTATNARASRLLRRLRCNRNRNNDLRNRRGVRWQGDFVSTHPQRRSDTRATAPNAAEFALWTGFGRASRNAGQEAFHMRTFLPRRSCSPSNRERYRTMARTKRSRRSYGAGEWGRNRVRVFPDPKTGLYQLEWRENGRRLTRSLGHREWVRAKRQADEFAAGKGCENVDDCSRGSSRPRRSSVSRDAPL